MSATGHPPKIPHFNESITVSIHGLVVDELGIPVSGVQLAIVEAGTTTAPRNGIDLGNEPQVPF